MELSLEEKVEMLEREVDDLISILTIYADEDSWEPDGVFNGATWKRSEDGWLLAKRVLGHL